MNEEFDPEGYLSEERLYEARQDYKADTQEEQKLLGYTKREPKTHNISFVDTYRKGFMDGMEKGDIVWIRNSGGSVTRHIVNVTKTLDIF